MAVSLPDLRDRVTEALREIIPEAPAVVIALGSELPESHRGAGIAYCGKDLDAALRPHIGFEGRAVAAVVEDATLLANQLDHAVARNLYEPTPSMVRLAFLESVCHELGHIVVNNWIPLPGDPDPLTAVVLERVEQLCKDGPDIRTESDLLAPWANHHGKWVRLYLHVAHRLSEALGIAIIPQLDEFHGLSSAWKYQAGLGGELGRLADVPLQKIRDIAPPQAFIEQWQADVKDWWLALPHPTEANMVTLFAWRSLFTT